MKERCLVCVMAHFVPPGTIIAEDEVYIFGERNEEGHAVTECIQFELTHIGATCGGGFVSALECFMGDEGGFTDKEMEEELERWAKIANEARSATAVPLDPGEPVHFVLAYDYWGHIVHSMDGDDYESGADFVGVVDWPKMITSLPLI